MKRLKLMECLENRSHGTNVFKQLKQARGMDNHKGSINPISLSDDLKDIFYSKQYKELLKFQKTKQSTVYEVKNTPAFTLT